MISVVETVVFYSDLSDIINLVVVSRTFSVVNYKIRTAIFIDDDDDADVYSYTLYIL